MFFKRKKVKVCYFTDKTTGRTYRPDEYSKVKAAIKEGHELVARFYFKYGLIEYESSKLLWIRQRKYKTERNGNVYYFSPFLR